MKKNTSIKVALIEDDKEIREHLAPLLDRADDIYCKQVFYRVEDAHNPLIADPPDVILMDISLPGMNGIEGVRLLKGALPEVEAIMLTVHQEDDLVFDSLRAGACGYLTKHSSPEKIIEAIREAYSGGAPMSTQIARIVVGSFKSNNSYKLSPREQDVLMELVNGKSYKMVADSLFISEDTVRSHIRNIYRKLEVNSKSEAVIKALKDKLV